MTHAGTVLALTAAAGPASGQSKHAFATSQNSRPDQTRDIQRYIDEATGNNKPAIIPEGSYRVSNLRLPEGCTIVGSGTKTILIGIGEGPILSAQDLAGVSLSALTIDARGARMTSDTKGAADFRNVALVGLSSVKIINASNDGIYLERCGGYVQGCIISKASRFGLFSMQSNGLEITDNVVSKCGNGGIIVHRWSPASDGTRIARNNVSQIGATLGGTGQWGNGINVFQANGVTINQNDIANCAFSAVRMNSAHDTIITQNKCIASGETAIYAEFAYRNVTIIGNEIDGAANGISATNFNNGGRGSIIQHNRIRNLTAPGPYKPEAPFFGHGISVEADGVVTDNSIETANGYGINIGWGPYLENVEVARNLIIDAHIGIGVSDAPGAGIARILSNKVRARDGAIRSHRWGEISAYDLLVAPENAPHNVALAGNVLI